MWSYWYNEILAIFSLTISTGVKEQVLCPRLLPCAPMWPDSLEELLLYRIPDYRDFFCAEIDFSYVRVIIRVFEEKIIWRIVFSEGFWGFFWYATPNFTSGQTFIEIEGRMFGPPPSKMDIFKLKKWTSFFWGLQSSSKWIGMLRYIRSSLLLIFGTKV